MNMGGLLLTIPQEGVYECQEEDVSESSCIFCILERLLTMSDEATSQG